MKKLKCKYLNDDQICYAEGMDPLGKKTRCVDVPLKDCQYEAEG